MFKNRDEYLDTPVAVVISTVKDSALVCFDCQPNVEAAAYAAWAQDARRPYTYTVQYRTRRFLNPGDRCEVCGKVLRE